ncbi:MAG: T9SS type A sorting domain-containing protein [Cytophagales bacterium]|nr:T9SS type A sorting domain-containing protein [Cytophagales bacterium]
MKKIVTYICTGAILSLWSLHSIAQVTCAGSNNFSIYTPFTCTDGSIVAQSKCKNYTVPYAAAAPVIDGIINDNVWTSSAKGNYNATTNTFPTAIAEEINLKIGATGDCGTANDVTSAEYGQFTGTFAMAWDVNFLYMVAYIKDANANNTAIPTGADKAGFEFFYSSDSLTSAHSTFATNWPRAYNSTKDMQSQINVKATGEYIFTSADISNPGGIQFAPADTVSMVTRTTADGYIVETRMPWKRLQSAFVDANNLYDANPANTAFYRRPDGGRKFRFDIGLQTVFGTKRAQKMWNMCCSNRNWSESQFFGTITLGPVERAVCGTLLGINPTSPAISTPNGTLDLVATISPAEASQAVDWSALEPAGADYATISSNGKITALKNGVITVTATSLVNADCPNTVSQTVLVNISGQKDPASIEITVADITRSWGSTAPTALVKDATPSSSGVPQNVTWSITAGDNLAFINSVTGLLVSKGVGNGAVTIKATSTVAPSVSATKVVNISNQAMPSSNTISGYGGAIDNPCRTASATTLVGFSGTNTKMTIVAYYDSAGCKNKVIPADFIGFTLTGPAGVTPPGNITYLPGNNSWELTMTNTTGVITLTSALKYDPTVKSIVRMQLRGSIVSTTLGTCTSLFNCGTTSISDGEYAGQELSIYPNPTSGLFNVGYYSTSAGEVSISVVNSVGSEVYYTKSTLYVGKNETAIKAALAPGLYIVNVSDGGKKLSKKLFVE